MTLLPTLASLVLALTRHTTAAKGKPVSPQRFPWFVRFFAKGAKEHWCSGAIVRDGWALTTAHAGLTHDGFVLRRPLPDARDRALKAVYPYTAFDCATGRSDICLVAFEPDGGPSAEAAVAAADDVTVLAWNLTLGALQLVEILPTDERTCRSLLADGLHVGADVLCGRTLAPSSRSPAQLQDGDSGSPLLSSDLTGVVGVLSRGRQSAPDGDLEGASALATLITPGLEAWMGRVIGGSEEPRELPACRFFPST